MSLALLAASVVSAAQAAEMDTLARRTEVARVATGGSGTKAEPWTGWEAAINALPANVVVHFSTGYYRPTTSLLPKDNWTVEGDGWGSVILGAGLNGPCAIEATGVRNLIIRDLQLDLGGQQGSDAHGLRVIRSDNVLIEGCWIHHAGWDGIRLGPSGDAVGTVTGARITNCLLEENAYMGIGATDYAGLVVADNIIRRNRANGMDLEPTASPATKNVNRGAAITGNLIQDNVGSGINLYNSTPDPSKGDTTITGNTIVGNAGGYAVQLYGQMGTTVTGNTLGTSLVGVYVYNGSRSTTISGNLIRNMSDAGVRIDGTAAQHTAITGNVIHDCGDGVRGIEGADYVSVLGNQFAGNTHAIVGLGAHSAAP